MSSGKRKGCVIMRKLQKKGMALGLALACLGFFGLDRAAQAAAPDSGGQSRAARPAVQKVVSVARVYGDGEKVAEAVLQYRRIPCRRGISRWRAMP